MSEPVSEAAIVELRKLAEAATPGEWVVEDPMEDTLWIVEAGKETYEWRCLATVSCDDPINDEDRDPVEPITAAQRDANAAFIAALNPATVLRILADRAVAEAQLREAERLLGAWERHYTSSTSTVIGAERRQETAAATRAFLSTGKPSKAKETAT